MTKIKTVADLLRFYYNEASSCIDLNKSFINIINSCKDVFLLTYQDVSALSTDILDIVSPKMPAHELAKIVAYSAIVAYHRSLIRRDQLEHFVNLAVFIYGRDVLVPSKEHFDSFYVRRGNPSSTSVEQLFIELTSVVNVHNLCYDSEDQALLLVGNDPKLVLYYLSRRSLFRNQSLCEGLALSLLDCQYCGDASCSKYYAMLTRVCAPKIIYELRASSRQYPYKFTTRLTAEDRRVLGLPPRKRLNKAVKPLYGFLAYFYTPDKLALVRELACKITDI